MNEKVTIWTKQHMGILDILERKGRYVVKKEYIEQKMEEHAGIYLNVYNWYHKAAGQIIAPPDDVKYPIWVSLSEEEKIGNSEGNVHLEIQINPSKLIIMDMDKWGRIVNYMYIPKDKADEEEHDKLLKLYNIDDTYAYMSPYFPAVKNKIIKSWDRLFDDSVVLSPVKVGTIWELKKEWIVNITK